MEALERIKEAINTLTDEEKELLIRKYGKDLKNTKSEILSEGMVDSITSFSSKISGYSYSCKFTVKLKGLDKLVSVLLLTNENGIVLTDEKGNALTINY